MMAEMGFEPIMAFSLDAFIFFEQAVWIFAICLLVAIYPLFKISGLKVIKALRS